MRRFDIEILHQSKTADAYTDVYDQTADDYDRGMVDELGWIAPDVTAARVQNLTPATNQILDAGAGTGLVGERLRAAGYLNIDGFDASPGMLKAAAAKGVYRNLKLAKLGNPLPYPDCFYDVVTASGVFTHHHAPAQSLDEVARVIRRGGFLVLTLRANADPGREVVDVVNDYEKKIKQMIELGHLTEIERSSPLQLRPRSKHLALHRICIYRVAG